ncbi:MAG: uracil-DNA glycosylase [Deltaproteobacteria bacterium]|nr:uracil-DNA glycosylase [Deltaproteobacteria bacterium]
MSKRSSSDATQLRALEQSVADCVRCPRLVDYRQRVACEKRRAFSAWEYWGRPVPSFGDRRARLLIVGLAPAAHGGNRTGRIFTGDRSGDWLYGTLHRFGFANQPVSTDRDDGLVLSDAYVTAAAHCAPPDNKPTKEEFANCQLYLERELELLSAVRVIVALGAIAFGSVLRAWSVAGRTLPQPKPRFGHDAAYDIGVTLIGSYHPSQRNTQTGFLTQPMFDAVFARARSLLKQRDSIR